jgi:O-antigen/teichoic acid export membrane protein
MIVGLLTVRGLTLVAGAVIVLWRSGISRPQITKIAPSLRYGLPLLPLGILHWVINASDRYFLAYFCEPEMVGIYSVSYSLGSIAGLAYAPIFFVLIPATSAAWNAGKSTEVLEYLRFAQKYPFLLVVPGILLLTGYAKQTIEVVATSQFAATPALIACVATAIVIMNIGAIVQTTLNVADFTRRILAISVAAALFNVVANAVAVPSYGAMGAAVATLLTYALQATATHMMSRSILSFPWAWLHMAKVLLAAVPLLLALSFGTRQPSLQPLPAIGGGLAYIGILIACGVFERREWQLVRAVLGRGQQVQ